MPLPFFLQPRHWQADRPRPRLPVTITPTTQAPPIRARIHHATYDDKLLTFPPACSGCNVIVNYAGSKDAAEAVAAEINAMGKAKAMAIKADTSNKDDVAAMFKAASEFIPGESVSVLVNNAGITVRPPFPHLPPTSLLRSKKAGWEVCAYFARIPGESTRSNHMLGR